MSDNNVIDIDFVRWFRSNKEQYVSELKEDIKSLVEMHATRIVREYLQRDSKVKDQKLTAQCLGFLKGQLFDK